MGILVVFGVSAYLFTAQAGAETQADQNKRWENARGVIQRAYEMLKSEEYSQYEKYFNYTQEKIAKEMDKGIPPEKAEEKVLGKDKNSRIAAVINFTKRRNWGAPYASATRNIRI